MSLRTLASFFGALLLASPVAAEAVHGESKDLGIRFVVQGGSHWCGEHVKVVLSAGAGTAFRVDTASFVDMLGRIRAVVSSQCPPVERISYDGSAKKKRSFAADTSRLTGWHKIVPLDLATGKPECEQQGAECAARAAAYVIAHNVMRGAAFENAEVTSTMESDSKDLTFKYKSSIGKLKVAARAQYAAMLPTPEKFADAVAGGIVENCTKEGGIPERTAGLAQTIGLGRASTVCRPRQGPAQYSEVLVWATADQFRVFSLLGPVHGDASDLIGALVKSIRSFGKYD